MVGLAMERARKHNQTYPASVGVPLVRDCTFEGKRRTMMDKTTEMSVDAFCMAVGSNGGLEFKYIDDRWQVTLSATYPDFTDEGWVLDQSRLIANGKEEHPALYTRRSLNKMFGTRNIKSLYGYYEAQWEAYNKRQQEINDADDIEIAIRESYAVVDIGDDGLMDEERAYFQSVDKIIEDIIRDDERCSAGIPPAQHSWYGSPDGPYNQ
jgi:hypothetical protein